MSVPYAEEKRGNGSRVSATENLRFLTPERGIPLHSSASVLSEKQVHKHARSRDKEKGKLSGS